MKVSASTDMFYTPAEVATILKISAKSVIGRFSGMQGVLTLPDANAKSGRNTAS
jgi:hypothetical protein